MMSAAAVTTRPVRSTLSRSPRTVSAPASHASRMRLHEEELVVHREAEEDREEKDRHPRLDLRRAIEAEHVSADAEPKDDDEQTVGRGDREPVEEHGDERQQERTEDEKHHQVGESENDADDPREGAVQTGEMKSTPFGGCASRRRRVFPSGTLPLGSR